MPQDDPIRYILDPLPIPNRLKATAWDAFHQHTDPEQVKAAMDALPLPADAKAKMWDLKFAQQAQPAGPAETPLDAPPDIQSVPRRIVGGAASMLLPSTTPSDYVTGPLYALQHPLDSLSLLFNAAKDATMDQAGKTKAAAAAAVSANTPSDRLLHTSQMLGHGMATAVPVLGPAAAATAEEFTSGDPARAVGMTGGLLAPFGAKRVPAPRIPGLGATTNPAEASAVAFAERRGIPVDAGTATGRPYIHNVQKNLSARPGSGVRIERARDQQADALSRVGTDLADGVHPQAVNPVAAGESVTKALSDLRAKHGATADAAYTRLRTLETQRAQMTQIGKDAKGQPIMQKMVGVNVKAAKDALRPIYDELSRENSLVPLQGDRARALVALDRLMQADDVAALSTVDAALGDLKTLGRSKDGVLKTHGKGVISEAVRQLDAQVTRTAKQAGQDVMAALQEGRKATVEKYRTDVVAQRVAGKDLSREPRAVFDALTADRDGGIARLRQVAKQTPAEVPKMGRAILEELLNKARSGGKFDHTDALLAEWNRLGAETKKLLFSTQVSELDDFFRLAATLRKNVNPSGTAQTLLSGPKLKGVLELVPNAILARLLYEPGGVKKLISGVDLPDYVKNAATTGGRTSVASGRTQAATAR